MRRNGKEPGEDLSALKAYWEEICDSCSLFVADLSWGPSNSGLPRGSPGWGGGWDLRLWEESAGLQN